MHGFNETNKNTQIEHGYKIKIQKLKYAILN